MNEELLVLDSPESLCCVLEQDTYKVLFQLRRTGNRSNMTEKLLTGM